MSANGLEVFDTTIQKTNGWLVDLMKEMEIENRHAAYQTLRAVLHTLRDRLTAEEVADFAAGMPMLVRGMFYEGWRPGRVERPERCLEAFLEDVLSHYGGRPYADAQEMCIAVFRVLNRHLPEGELRDVRHQLSGPVRALWPEQVKV